MIRPERQRVLIVGGGASGLAVAWNLLRQATEPIEIAIADPSSQLGLGVAYSTKRDDYVLNVPAGRMGLDVADPNHFVQWVGCGPDDFISRRIYGQYLQSALQQAIADSKSCKFRHIQAEVIDLKAIDGGFEALGPNGTLGVFDQVVLAVGVGELFEPTFTKGLQGTEGYVADVWGGNLNYSDGVIACVGTGLTFVDHALAALRDFPSAKVLGFSRTGWLPESHLPSREPALPVPQPARASAAGIVGFIDSAGSAWRAAQDGVRHDLPEIWHELPEPEKQEFLTKHWRWWNVRRHRSAPEIGAELLEQVANGRVEIVSGEIEKIKTTPEGFRIAMQDDRVFKVDQVLNCTGQDLDVVTPLLNRLLSDGLVIRGPLGLGLGAEFDTYRLIGVDRKPQRGLYAIGKVLFGERFETTAIPELKGQAAQIANQLLSE